MTLPTFDAKRACRKCGGTDIYSRHMEEDPYRLTMECVRSEKREHMHRYCRCCGFVWDEAPLDAEGTP